MALDSSGNAILGGETKGGLNAVAGNIQHQAGFLIKYGASGAHQWSTHINSNYFDSVRNLVVASDDSVYAFGIKDASNGAFLAKYSSSGVQELTRSERG